MTTSLTSRKNLFQNRKLLLEKLGISVVVAMEVGDELKVLDSDPKDGHLVSLPSHQPVCFSIFLKVPRDPDFQVVSVYGRQRNIALKHDILPENLRAVYEKKIKNRKTRAITSNGYEVLSTKHEGNNVRVVIAKNGIFQMWEVAIPTRIINNEAFFFLTIQRLYQGNIFNLDRHVYIPDWQFPGYKKWKDFQSLIFNIVKDQKLKKIKIEIPKSNKEQKELSKNHGEVIFFCLASGLGVIRTNEGPALFHWSDINSCARFVYLLKGDLVEYGEIVRTGVYFIAKEILAL